MDPYIRKIVFQSIVDGVLIPRIDEGHAGAPASRLLDGVQQRESVADREVVVALPQDRQGGVVPMTFFRKSQV